MAFDSPSYLAMAQQFASGHARVALAAVFSPLYPLLIALMHRIVPEWGVAGEAVSTGLGTATVPLLYLLFREVYGRSDVGIGAAALAAIHPQLAGYSAEVMTHASYLCLMTAAILLLAKAVNGGDVACAIGAGAAGGIAYLCRTEGIGLLAISVVFIPLAAVIWRRFSFGRALVCSGAFAAGFLLLGLPYMVYLHGSSGHWMVGREFNATWMWGAYEPSLANANTWQVGSLGHNFRHLLRQFLASFPNFATALEPLLVVPFAVGLWKRGRATLRNPCEALLASVVVFYFLGLDFFSNQPRYLAHIIPYTFGWVMVGTEVIARTFVNLASRVGWPIPGGAVALGLAFVLLPQTLWPLGYDRRGIRYAGEEIARRRAPGAVAAHDPRVAAYASAGWIFLPDKIPPDICQWLHSQPDAAYALLDQDDERSLGGARAASCLELMKRYPRKHRGEYYDLFAVNR